MNPPRRLLAAAFALAAVLFSMSCERGKEPSSAEQAAAAAGRKLDRARHERTLNKLEQLRTALTRYAVDHEGTHPVGSSLAGISGELSPQYVPLLDAEDAWGNTMTYSTDGRSYSIVSAGPDGVSGTTDDIALRDGAIFGGS